MYCSICEKVIYARHEIVSNSLVCGSCVFTETKGLKTKSLVAVQEKLFEATPIDTSYILRVMDIMMKVKCNYARERWIDIAGSPVLFDENGVAEVPESMKYAFEEIMRVRPGRFSFVVEAAPATATVKKAAPVAEPAPAKVDKSKNKPEKKSFFKKKEGK